MFRNVFKWSILLCALAFLLSSCEAFRPVQDASARTEVRKPKKNTRTKAREEPKRNNRDSEVVSVRRSLVRHARKQIGVKYKHGGKTPRGFDCSGYTSYVYQQENMPLSPGSQAQAATGKKIRLRDAQPGDLVFFSKNGRVGRVSHVAMVVENTGEELVVIHSTSSKGVMEQDVMRSSYWKPKMLFARDVLTDLSGTSLTRR